MLILAFLFLSYAAACWFSGKGGSLSLNIPLLEIDPMIPFLLAIAAVSISLIIRVCRRGERGFSAIIDGLRRNRAGVAVLALILVVHIAVELPPLIMVAGANDSDTGLYGLAGYHIAEGKDRPVFAYGRNYIGTLIPHLTAVPVAIFGKQPVWFRLVNTTFYLGFLTVLFSLCNKLWDRKKAAVITLVAAIPPFEILNNLKYSEFPEIFFWGTLSLLILTRVLEKKRGAAGFFWYGAVLGIGFYAHPQMVYFILTGLAAFFISDKLFFISARFWAALPGFIAGSTPVWLEAYASGFRGVGYFLAKSTALTHSPGGIPEGFLEFWIHFIPLTGCSSDQRVYNLFGSAICLITMASLAMLLTLFVWKNRKVIGEAVLLKNVVPGPATFLLLALMVFILFITSDFSAKTASSTRYLLPLWITLSVIIGAGIHDLFGIRKWLGAPALIPVLVSLISLFYFYGRLNEMNDTWQEWIEFCRQEKITGYYGHFWRTHQVSFITGEEIIGSNAYHQGGNLDPNQVGIIGDQDRFQAFLFSANDKRLMRTFRNKLEALGLAYETRQTGFGTVFLHFQGGLTPQALLNIGERTYSGRVNISKTPIATVGSGRNLLYLFEAGISNTGETDWFSDGKNGYINLVVRSGSGTELSRIPLEVDLPAGESTTVRIPYQGLASTGGALSFALEVNGFQISQDSLVDLSKLLEATDLKRLPEIINADASGSIEPFMLFGWGGVIQKDGLRTLTSAGRVSTLGFVLPRRKNAKLTLTAHPIRDANLDLSPQIMTIYLNGKPITEPVTLARRKRIRLLLPRQMTIKGLNTLTFRYARIEPSYRLYSSGGIFQPARRAVAFTQLVIR